MPTETEIKAELFDIQHHNCTGRFTVTTDGMGDPGDHPCALCVRVRQLYAMLRAARKEKGGADG